MPPVRPDPRWALACEALGERIGLHFPPERIRELRRALLAAATELGLRDADACVDELLAGRLDEARMDIVASHLTVGETYFMRGDETFAALREHVLPGLIDAARKDGSHALRLWSAGCATGEEAYSLAILIGELLPDHASWRVDILATDVNPRFLAKAESGVYGEWSFRGTDADFRRRHFHRCDGGRFALNDGIRDMVRFAPLNLVDADAMRGLVQPASFDLILCRNVLMYFVPAQALRVMADFHRGLRRGGWMIMAPCEISQPLLARFESVVFEGAIFHRRLEDGPRGASTRHPRTATPVTPMSPVSRDPASSTGHVPAPRQSAPASPAGAPSPPQPVPHVDTTSADPAALEREARALADQGQLDEALACCDRWVAASKLDAAAHYLRAAILMEGERWDEAREALQRCLYLAPEDAMANFALGNVEGRLGRPDAARRQYRNTLALLQRRRSSATLDDEHAITVAQLDRMVRNLLPEGRRA